MAPPSWNAGFSRHSGPQGRGRFVATPGAMAHGAAPPRQMGYVSPPAFGGLCRLKPAFQAAQLPTRASAAPAFPMSSSTFTTTAPAPAAKPSRRAS